jgi:DNA-binding NarL/FixJ family response regulator
MTKIILADNHAIFRSGIEKILGMANDFHIIAQCRDADQLYRALDASYGAVLMFAATLEPDLNALTKRVSKAGSRSIAILESSDSPLAFSLAGVDGMVDRSVGRASLLECIRRVGGGERFHQLPADNFKRQQEDTVGARVRDRLTPRELKVVALTARGNKNKEIADRLGIGVTSVKNYLCSIYDKMGVYDRLEMALFVVHHKTLAEAVSAIGESSQRRMTEVAPHLQLKLGLPES